MRYSINPELFNEIGASLGVVDITLLFYAATLMTFAVLWVLGLTLGTRVLTPPGT